MIGRLVKREPPIETTNQAIADKIIEQLKEGAQYKRTRGYYDMWNECEKFDNSDQWPAATPKTKDLPRPVLNMVKRVNNMKTATVLSEPPTVTFLAKEGTPEEGIDQFDQEGAELFTQVAKNNTWENVKMSKLNKRTVYLAAKLGTSYKHWYWDQTIIGGTIGKTAYIGDINGEVLGPDKVYLGNPQEKDLQKQPFILIVGQIPIQGFYEAYAESAAKLGIDINEIKPDKQTDYLVLDASKQTPNDDYITLIHKYQKVFKGIKSYVYYSVVAGGKTVRHETPLYEGDLYPISYFTWYEQEDDAHGIGETQGLIPNQKQVNRLLAMYLLALYKVGMPKISYNPLFVDVRDISTNMPGGIVKDTSPGGLTGWKYVQPAIMSGDIPNIVQQLTELSKDLAGANEAFLGESAPDNATAIMMLQKQANAPVQEVRDRFFESIEDDMHIWELFYKRFYSEERLVKLSGDNREGYAWFRGTDYYDLNLTVRVEAGAGSAYSETLMISELKELKADQTITPDEYLEFLPKQVFPFAQQVIERRKQQQVQQQGMMNGQPMANDPLASLPPEVQQNIDMMAQQGASEEEIMAFVQQVMGQQTGQPVPAAGQQNMMNSLGGGAIG